MSALTVAEILRYRRTILAYAPALVIVLDAVGQIDALGVLPPSVHGVVASLMALMVGLGLYTPPAMRNAGLATDEAEDEWHEAQDSDSGQDYGFT